MCGRYRIYNTWMGDPAKLLMLKAVLEVVESEGLIESTARTGATLYKGLEQIVAANPDKLFNLRGSGTMLAFDSVSTEARGALLNELRARGLLIGVCGPASFRLRPSLNFNDHHAAIFLDRFEAAVSSV